MYRHITTEREREWRRTFIVIVKVGLQHLQWLITQSDWRQEISIPKIFNYSTCAVLLTMIMMSPTKPDMLNARFIVYQHYSFVSRFSIAFFVMIERANLGGQGFMCENRQFRNRTFLEIRRGRNKNSSDLYKWKSYINKSWHLIQVFNNNLRNDSQSSPVLH